MFCTESVTLQGNAPLLIDGFALVAALEDKKKQRFLVALRSATWTLFYQKFRIDVFTSGLYATVIGSTPSRQQQDVDSPRTRCRLCADILKEERFCCR